MDEAHDLTKVHVGFYAQYDAVNRKSYNNSTPQWIVQIGCDEGGDSFCFSLKECEEGKIYYLAHEFYDGKNGKKEYVY